MSVYGVPAYSTLGWPPARRLDGDPLLNTFIHWPEGELARLIFHELAHQAYGQATTPPSTNPSPPRSSASAAARWLAGRPRQRAREEYAVFDGAPAGLPRADDALARAADGLVPPGRERRPSAAARPS